MPQDVNKKKLEIIFTWLCHKLSRHLLLLRLLSHHLLTLGHQFLLLLSSQLGFAVPLQFLYEDGPLLGIHALKLLSLLLSQLKQIF